MKPKLQGQFTYQVHWDEPGITHDSGVTYDSSTANAVIRHQLNQAGFPTSGISTTPHLQRAIYYAQGEDRASSGYVFKINRDTLKQNGIDEYVVAQFCSPSIPEDDEVILVLSDSSHLPSSVIVEVIPVNILS